MKIYIANRGERFVLLTDAAEAQTFRTHGILVKEWDTDTGPLAFEINFNHEEGPSGFVHEDGRFEPSPLEIN